MQDNTLLFSEPFASVLVLYKNLIIIADFKYAF